MRVKHNAKLIDTSNVAYKFYIQENGRLVFKDTSAYFYTSENLGCSFRTSDILNYTRTDNILEFETLNSIYAFEVDNSIGNPHTIELTYCQKRIINYMKSLKSNHFECMSYDEEYKTKVYDYIKFDKPITRKVALDILKNDILYDSKRNRVFNIFYSGIPKEMILNLPIHNDKYISIDAIRNTELKECFNLFLLGRPNIIFDKINYIDIKYFKEFLNS